MSRLRPRRASAGETVEQLRSRTRSVREQLAAKPAEPLSQRRYQAPDAGGESDALPMTDTAPPEPAPPSETAPEAETSQPREASHVDRLLRAKRRARGQDTDEDKT